jgi:hypothetical protein
MIPFFLSQLSRSACFTNGCPAVFLLKERSLSHWDYQDKIKKILAIVVGKLLMFISGWKAYRIGSGKWVVYGHQESRLNLGIEKWQ